MKFSVDKLRWGLAGALLGLLLVLTVFVGYGRYKAGRLWKKYVDKFGAHIEKQTDGFTYSQSLQGRTVFRLHAAKAVQHSEGKVTLHDVVLTLYGRGAGQVDRIYGNQFEYDDNEGTARAVGDVQMDLSVPHALAKAGTHTQGAEAKPSAAADGDVQGVHVRTSGLVYMRKLGVAATDERVDFAYAGLQCTSKGAEFDTSESIVHLLAEVHLTGELQGRPLQLHASKADLNRTANTVALVNPQAESKGQKLRATQALFHLRTDGSIETGHASGNVMLEQGTRRLTALEADGSFRANSTPEQAKLRGGVTIDDTDPIRPMHGTAEAVDATFDAAGAPLHVLAIGNAMLHAAAASKTSQNKAGQTNSPPLLARTIKGQQIEAMFHPGLRQKATASDLTEVHANGTAMATAESPATPQGVKTTQVAADDLHAYFDPSDERTPDLRQITGDGHTHLQQDAPGGEQQTSNGDKLQVAFSQGPNNALQIASATQTGHVQIQSRPAQPVGSKAAPDPVFAGADQSTYNGTTEKMTLTGGAHFTQGGTSVSASSITVDQRSGDSDAQGMVLATFVNAGQANAEAAHVRSDSAHLQHAKQFAEFHSTDAHPARLWEGPSQVLAANLFIDGIRHTLAARPERAGGLVHAVFASSGEEKSTGTGTSAKTTHTADAGSRVVTVVADTMDYDDAARAATFGGNVFAQGETGTVQVEHAVAFLTPAQTTPGNIAARSQTRAGLSQSFGGSLQRVVMWGGVHMQQPDRNGTGDRLVYSAADSSFVLTGSPGKPPQITDAKQGNVTGAALLFRSGDSTIIVSGTASAAGGLGRVRTETGAKQ